VVHYDLQRATVTRSIMPSDAFTAATLRRRVALPPFELVKPSITIDAVKATC
jgi:hypothetical protein